MKYLRQFIHGFSIRSKLTIIITGTSLIVLLILFTSFVLTQRILLRNALLQELRVLGQNLSGNCSTALIFNDVPAAEEILSSLKSKPQVLTGLLLDKNGSVFSSYQKRAAINLKNQQPDPTLLEKGFLFQGRTLEIAQPIRFQEEDNIGLLLIRADLSHINQVLFHHAILGAIGFAGALIFAWFLAARLQKVISGPIEQLAKAMRDVTIEKDYSRRVLMDRSDELGILAETFNNMLEQVEFRDLELQQSQQNLHHLAHHDTLTGLSNRLLFNDYLGKSLMKAKAGKTRLALLFIDLDRFKNINDSLGHKVGDEVLRATAERLSGAMAVSDMLARLGGDEFVVIVEQVESYETVSAVAEKLLDILSQPVQIGKQELFVSGSIGISIFPEDGESVKSLMQCADVAMYQAKGRGRNNYQFFTSGMTARAQEELLLEGKLRNAIHNNELLLYYQPQVDLLSGQIIGMEALIRWQHPLLGLVPPEKFIPLAEESGLILSLGKWVLHAACKQAVLWRQAGFPSWKMAVNISPKQFWQADLVEVISEALAESGFDPRLLELEITESAIMLDAEKAIDTMKLIRGMGISLAIDDFGTGYSSLSCLQRFPLSKLKIDKSFVRDIFKGEDRGAIAQGIVGLARTLKLEVIAEGIEEKAQMEFLISKGCFLGQGYYLGRPMPAENMPLGHVRDTTSWQGLPLSPLSVQAN